MNLITIIDGLLPQTQCTKCGYQGCKPYAQAIAGGAEINHCPPGGDETIKALANLLDVPVVALAEPASVAQIAYIREEECIGCTKCIQACPVDAIVGSAKLMHTVISSECTGCDLCIAPCPVDCIDMRPLPLNLTPMVGDLHLTEKQRVARKIRRDHARNRFEARAIRLKNNELLRKQAREIRLGSSKVAKAIDPKLLLEKMTTQKAEATPLTAEQKRLKIDTAMAQVALKKLEKQLKQHQSLELQEQLEVLQNKLTQMQQALIEAGLTSG